MNWTEAQTHCRQTYIDLATVCSKHDMDKLTAAFPSDFTEVAWIGLERGLQWRWQWSFSDKDFYVDSDVDFRNWRSKPPNPAAVDRCAVLEPNGKWIDDSCSTQRHFVCFNESAVGDLKYVLIKENKSWREAQRVCRERHVDLVSVRSNAENNAIKAVVKSQAWIGLFSDPWVWSDHSNSSFRFWGPDQPDNVNNVQDCVAVTHSRVWNVLRCNTSRRFFCYSGDINYLSPFMSNLPTDMDAQFASTTPSITTDSADFTVPVHSSQTAYTHTYHAGQTQHSNGVHVLLQTVTEDTAHGSSDQVTTSHAIHTVTSEEETTAHTPVHQTTDDPAPTSSLFTDTLILVRENMSWIEALTYCRAHHTDLVSVTDPRVQQEVAQKVANASTPHAWLGLRYTCKFSFWFWTSSASVCYQNWAPGHGPGGQRQCGLAGAIEASRGNQWVSLSETYRLNFICRL
ncbi:hypothetical protein ACEWY4_019478 [Coilia grayii]|uniref:C-type lectin domain-containing protein n=1 Tax=Coilia grayii TaxID=363190 RepID=A0ABD1J9T6_9TELE